MAATATPAGARAADDKAIRQLNAWCATGGVPVRSGHDQHFARTSLQWQEPGAEWQAFIREAWWGRDHRPGDEPHLNEMRRLRTRLLAFGGHSACLPCRDRDLLALETRGQLWFGNSAVPRKGERGRCHENSAILWSNYRDGWRGGRLVLCTGYALSPDGMWRQHSWCLWRRARSIRVVETTLPRIAYFGFAMTDDEASEFLLSVLP